MKFEFTPLLSHDHSGKATIISGSNSIAFSNVEYLILKDDDANILFLGSIHHEYCGLPFKQAILEDNLLAVGHQGHFYLYDIQNNKCLCSLEVSGYFGHLYFNEGLFYVTSAYDIYCINRMGNVIWKGDIPSVDGTLVNSFEGGRIYLSCQVDPPDLWEDIVLDEATGKRIG